MNVYLKAIGRYAVELDRTLAKFEQKIRAYYAFLYSVFD